MAGGDAEQGAEGGVPGAPAVEAKDEFVEVGLEIPAAQAVIDAQGPTTWFWAAYLMATHSNGISALQLHALGSLLVE